MGNTASLLQGCELPGNCSTSAPCLDKSSCGSSSPCLHTGTGQKSVLQLLQQKLLWFSVSREALTEHGWGLEMWDAGAAWSRGTARGTELTEQ